ncbi:MAG TPA: valine--tRNA ligase [Planctomycetota bacterium]|nr:valine--tRNA ligase [Planctomycetota bacterium]
MPVTLDSRYDPRQVEDRIYRAWEAEGCFGSQPDADRVPYTVAIPPPNVTGALHMGHALNNTVQDILVRARRMQGRNTLWLPGTDHAGIATQTVVDKMLKKDGFSREGLGREKFLERVWQWKGEYGGRIIGQLKRLGASCDWSRQRFTMDEGLAKAVTEAFCRLFEKGLIYRGHYLVNWCPSCRTALADDEVEHEESDGWLWHIRYPSVDGRFSVVVATTRPETMLGDTAVAVNPEDERYKALVGKRLRLPLVGREVPIIADPAVDMSFGTGAVKVTPAHDPADFEMGNRHNLPRISILDEDGRTTAEAGAFANLDRAEARERVVAELERERCLEKTEPHRHSVGRHDRCHMTIEPRLSDQWFVKMKPLAEAAIEASRSGRVKFHPARWEKVYLSWLENVRDWCISRQIWWGHRIPVWYCRSCEKVIAARSAPEKCPRCGGAELRQDEDVLDTWFSSSLWPFSTLGWPAETADLAYYYPTSALVTDRGIIYFWVARMVMMGLELMRNVPFRDVCIHGTVLDETGAKMSKSKGNGIDPIVMIEGGTQEYLGKPYESPGYGADAVRFSLMVLTTEGQDVKLSPSKFEMGRNFCNKVWNASRFVLMNLEGLGKPDGSVADEDLAREDRWILSRLELAVERTGAAIDAFRFNDAAQAAYDFVWRDFCDWYVELSKARLRRAEKAGDAAGALLVRRLLAYLLDRSLRLLHPVTPFITEELWTHLNASCPDRECFSLAAAPASGRLMTAPWPRREPARRDERLEAEFELVQEIVREVRNIRQKTGVPAREKVQMILAPEKGAKVPDLSAHLELIAEMSGSEMPQVRPGIEGKPEGYASAVLTGLKVFVGLGERHDAAGEKARLEAELAKEEDLLARSEARLANQSFLAKAPPKLVEEYRTKRDEIVGRIHALRKSLESL